jgi:hypothetical protein
MTEINHPSTENVIDIIMNTVARGDIESRQAVSAVKHIMGLGSKPENLIGKSAENPIMQEFLNAGNTFASDNDCVMEELRGFVIKTKDGSIPSRNIINGLAQIYRGLPEKMRFGAFSRAGSALLVLKEKSNGD